MKIGELLSHISNKEFIVIIIILVAFMTFEFWSFSNHLIEKGYMLGYNESESGLRNRYRPFGFWRDTDIEPMLNPDIFNPCFFHDLDELAEEIIKNFSCICNST